MPLSYPDLGYFIIFLKEYDDYRDAREAVEEMDGYSFEGHKIIVQEAGKKSSRGPRGPQADDKCYKCGKLGHW